MGGHCSKGTPVGVPYDIASENMLDHYVTGEALGRGAYGVVKTAVLKPEAVRALKATVATNIVPEDAAASASGRKIARRRRFVDRPLAVKVMRHDSKSSDGDSSERLVTQIDKLEAQINEIAKSTDSQNLSQFEELQWLREYSENLKSKLADKQKSQTKKTPRDMMLREVTLVEKCDHQFIMQLVETFESDRIFCVIFERCYGSVITRYPAGVFVPHMVARFSYQLLSAITYLHGRFLLHRDIKPENLLFRTQSEDAEVVLGDFGMAVELRKMDDRCQGCAGTPHFVPPEGFHSYYQSFPSDVWACGCTTYWMLVGRCPFEESSDAALEKKSKLQKSFQTTAIFGMWRSARMGQVLQGWKPQFEHDQTANLARKICHPREEPAYALASGELLDDQATDLLRKMISKNPLNRISASATLLHPWLLAGLQDTPHPVPGARVSAPASEVSGAPAASQKTQQSIVGKSIDKGDAEPKAALEPVPQLWAAERAPIEVKDGKRMSSQVVPTAEPVDLM